MNRHKHRQGLQMNSGLQARLLVVILTLLSLTLPSCSQKQTAPTVIGQRRVLSIDQDSGTVTITLNLWAEMMRTLKRCSERSTP